MNPPNWDKCPPTWGQMSQIGDTCLLPNCPPKPAKTALPEKINLYKYHTFSHDYEKQTNKNKKLIIKKRKYCTQTNNNTDYSKCTHWYDVSSHISLSNKKQTKMFITKSFFKSVFCIRGQSWIMFITNSFFKSVFCIARWFPDYRYIILKLGYNHIIARLLPDYR